MKKFLATIVLAGALIVGGNAVNTAHAFSLNPNYDFVEVTSLRSGVYDAVVSKNIDFLALRSGPSASYSMIARIPPGAHIKVIIGNIAPSEYRFERVEYNGIEGYAHSRYFTFI